MKEQQTIARIEKLETALRWIVKSCDVRIHRLSLFDEIQQHARTALEVKTTKTKKAKVA